MRLEAEPVFLVISIHSPHARGDGRGCFAAGCPAWISIHSPHARGDPVVLNLMIFPRNFNPLPSCEGRHHRLKVGRCRFTISIHSPHARGDAQGHIPDSGRDGISIHSPHARGDVLEMATSPCGIISIHSPHARGDPRSARALPIWLLNFNPLPSCEGRRGREMSYWAYDEFQSTPLMRGETPSVMREADLPDISIHSPHARGDLKA